MSQHLTIAYMTARLDPKIEWFLDSLITQADAIGWLGLSVVVVDFHRDNRELPDLVKRSHLWSHKGYLFRHIAPKPTVWQGPHRLTKDNWFAASNARNTALGVAPDGWLAYVDDLSVLMPGWLARVREAMKSNVITLGAYKKVKNLVVENGLAVSYDEFPGGIDSRWPKGSNVPVQAAGSWLFGCSLAAPVEALLSTNGWPEHCDGLSFEDCIMGIALEKKGWRFQYDRAMLTLESEELHHVGPVMKRSDYGVSPNDKSHAVLNQAMQGNGWHANYFDEGGIRALRDRVLNGAEFPVMKIPQHEFFTGKRLEEL